MKDLPKSIDEVISELDSIIEDSMKRNDYLCLFAYVYRRTTAQIRQAILDRQFEDNERMEKMDVNFANKYLEAYRNFTVNEPCSQSWHIPFMAKDEKLTIMQHLLMGMNAHINLDLGVAASEVAPGEAINRLKNDFMKVNGILASLTNEMQLRTARISWWMFLLDWFGGNTDEAVINFSMIKAREQAWDFACRLAPLDESERASEIAENDRIISELAKIIKSPPGMILRSILKFISRFEETDVKKIVEELKK